MANLALPKVNTVLTEPFQVPDIFITGMEHPFIHMDFARLIFWTDHPPVFGHGADPVVERHIAAKLVMTKTTFAAIRAVIAKARDSGG